jgi:hypothetical protein
LQSVQSLRSAGAHASPVPSVLTCSSVILVEISTTIGWDQLFFMRITSFSAGAVILQPLGILKIVRQ